MLRATILGYVPNGLTANVTVLLKDTGGTYNLCVSVPLSIGVSDDQPTIEGYVTAAITSYLNVNGLPTPDVYQWLESSPSDVAAAVAASGLPMYVSGVAKTNYYAVAASPTVAGGAGVARFYIDTNGDGTGTAPSEVFSASLQAVVFNTTVGYVPQSFTVDTNRKYIDVKMGTLSFSGLTLLGQTVLGSQTIANAANGTVVNCFVLVKQ